MARRHHHGHKHRRERGRVGHCGARQPRKDDAGDDRHIPQAAAHMPHQRHGKFDNAPGNPARVHQLASQDKERYGHQGEVVGTIEQIGRQDLCVELAQEHHQRNPTDQ